MDPDKGKNCEKVLRIVTPNNSKLLIDGNQNIMLAYDKNRRNN